MYSSYSAAAFALRSGRPSLHAHSSSSSYVPSSHHHHHHHGDDGRHHELLPLNPHVSSRFLLDGYLLRHSTHLLLLSARLRPPPPPHQPHCCRRRAAARCCSSRGGCASARPVTGHISWRSEARGCRCCEQGAGRSDLGAVCRRLEAPRGCRCGGSGSGRLDLGAGYGRRDAPRLLVRAVRQEVWEYDGGELPHRSCSMECYDDWEEEAGECGLARWEMSRMPRLSRRQAEDDDDRCRDCRRRKGVESDYYDEDEYSGRRRERRDVNDRRGWDHRDDLDVRRQRERRDRRDFESDDAVDTRRVGARRYTEDDRKYHRGRESRDYEYDDAVDTRRAGARKYTEDDRKYHRGRERRDYEYDNEFDARRVGVGRYTEDNRRYDRRTERRDYEIEDEDDVRREGRHHSKYDERFVMQHPRRSEGRKEDVSIMRSHRWHDKECDNDDQDIAEQKYYSRDSRSQMSASALREDDSQRASSSRNTVDTRVARKEENSASRVRWHDTVDRQADETSMEREQWHSSSVGWSNNEKDEYDYHDARLVKVRDSRTGTHDVKVITEDDVTLASSSKNTSILKNHSNVDQKVAARKDETRKSSQRIMETSEVRDDNTERNSRTQSYHQEDRRNYVDNESSSLQTSVKMVSDSRKQIDQHDEVDQQVIAVTDSRIKSENLTDITMDSSCNVSRTSRSQRNYDEVNQKDIEDRSTSVHNITHITRDKKRYVNQQVIHETDIDVQNVTHVDVSKIHAIDTVVASSSHEGSDNQARRTSAVNRIDQASESRGNSDRQMTQGSRIVRNDQVSTKFSGSSQDYRERLTRAEEAESPMHNIALNWQQASTSRISDDKDITSFGIKSTEEASMVNADEEQIETVMGRSEQEIRSGTSASSIPSGSSARKPANASLLESAARLEKSSTFHVGQFVGELHKGVSDAGTTSTRKNEKSIMEGTARSSSRSRMGGPSDEMWDVQSATSQETFKTADKDEGSSADGATNSASQTPKGETALARKSQKSLWSYVADIARLGWIQRGESHDSSNKSVKKSSSSNSQSTEGWISSQGHDNDAIQNRSGNSKAKDQQLMKAHSGGAESRVVSPLKDESLPTGLQGLEISEVGSVSDVGRFKGYFAARVSKNNVQIPGERTNLSEVGASPKGTAVEGYSEDITSPSIDVTTGHLLDHEAATSSWIRTKSSAETNTGNAMLAAGSSSMTINAEEAGGNGDADDRRYESSVAITPYRPPQSQAMMPDANTSATFREYPELPTRGSTRSREKIGVQETPEVIRTEGKDGELKMRKFQRNKQVGKEKFDEWEEAYQHDAAQRKTDELFMREALLEAQRAADIWEVPVGAVLVHNGEIIARGCNLVEDQRDSTAHAEIVCIREASNKLRTWRLADTTLYVTLEPCPMCAGAILQARINTVVWGAPNKLLGADGSWVRLFPGDGQTSTLDSANQTQTAGPVHPFHPNIVIRRGVLSSECSEIMQQFFHLRRRKKKQRPESPPRARHHGHHNPVKFFSKMHHMFGAVFCL